MKLFQTNYQKILVYLATNPGSKLVESEIQKATGVSKSGTNYAVKALVQDGLVRRDKKGKTSLYYSDPAKPIIRQVKVMLTLLKIAPIVSELEKISEKIVLFGSSANGTDIETSDIDLFILTNAPEKALKRTGRIKSLNLQVVAMKPIGYISLEKKDPVFYDEISRGITLWEKKSE